MQNASSLGCCQTDMTLGAGSKRSMKPIAEKTSISSKATRALSTAPGQYLIANLPHRLHFAPVPFLRRSSCSAQMARISTGKTFRAATETPFSVVFLDFDTKMATKWAPRVRVCSV